LSAEATNRELRRQSLIEFNKLFVGHRVHSSIPAFVEAIQGDMFPGDEACLHETAKNNSEGAIRFGLHNDANRSWTRLDY
jgi:hypothetical protein